MAQSKGVVQLSANEIRDRLAEIEKKLQFLRGSL